MQAHGPNETRLTFSPRFFVSAVLVGFAAWLLYAVRDILVLFLIVVAIVVAFSPIIKSWQRYMSRGTAIILLYLLIAVGVLLVTALILPPLISQSRDFVTYIQDVVRAFGAQDGGLARVEQALNNLLQGRGLELLSRLASQINFGTVYTTTAGVIGGIVAAFTVLVSSYYLLNEERNFQNFVASIIPGVPSERVHQVIDRISDKMGSWLRGQLLLMVIVGVLVTVGLAVLGVPYALLLGLWAGVTEVLPYVGPILGALPGIALAFLLLGPIQGVIAIAIYAIIQQIEGQVLVPKIMGKALGLSPVVIIFALLIGGKLLGFVGLIIAVPLAAALSVLLDVWRNPNGHKEVS